MPPTKARLWTGRILTGLMALFLIADGISHIIMPPQVVEPFNHLGIPVSVGPALGVVVLLCVALHLIPRTSHLGVVLLTAYLGGAVSIHVRAKDPVFDTVFPIVICVLVWLGLYLRDQQVKDFILGK